jgi:hypothetical protein
MVKLSTKIALGVWFVVPLVGFIIGIVAINDAKVSIIEHSYLIGIGFFYSLYLLVMAMLFTLALCNVKDGE